jgi:hypothetical protein
MQHNDCRKAKSLDLRLQDACQQEAAALAEALERWLDDGGTADNEVAHNVGVGDFSPLQFFFKAARRLAMSPLVLIVNSGKLVFMLAR